MNLRKLVNLFSLWKHKKPKGFLISGGKEVNQFSWIHFTLEAKFGDDYLIDLPKPEALHVIRVNWLLPVLYIFKKHVAMSYKLLVLLYLNAMLVQQHKRKSQNESIWNQ